jgi:hypothetical protein
MASVMSRVTCMAGPPAGLGADGEDSGFEAVDALVEEPAGAAGAGEALLQAAAEGLRDLDGVVEVGVGPHAVGDDQPGGGLDRVEAVGSGPEHGRE